MTVNVETNRVPYIGAGIVGPFAITFPFLANADIKVIKTLIAAPFTQTVLVLTTDYTLTGAGAAAGGTLTLVAALPATYTLTIYRDPAVTQVVDYLPNDGFPAETHERALDRLTMICNRFRDLLARAFRLSDGDTSGIDLTITAPVANAFIKINAAATALEFGLSAGVLAVSAYGQTLLNSANAAAARALLLSTVVGDALFIAVSAAAARITLGFSAIAAKGDLFVGTAANTIGTLTIGATNGQVLVVDSTQASGFRYGTIDPYPINVNPNLTLDQINEGAAYNVAAATVKGPDGFTGKATGAGTFTMQRVVDPDNAALTAIKIACTVADAALAAADDYTFWTALEGCDVSALQSGVASAGQISVRCKMKWPAAGTYGVFLQNSAGNRSYVQNLVVPDANENEYTLTWQLDTAGAWLYAINTVGILMGFCLGSGTNFQGVVGSWQAAGIRAGGANTNFMALNTNIMYLKRIHVFPGPVALPYAVANHGRDLAKAQRQYHKTWNQGVAVGTVTNVGAAHFQAGADTLAYCNIFFPVTMCGTPTGTTYSPATGTAGNVRNEGTGADVAGGFDAYISMNKAGIAGVGFAAANQPGSVHGAFDKRLS